MTSDFCMPRIVSANMSKPFCVVPNQWVPRGRFEEGLEVQLVVSPRRHEGAEVREHEQQQHDGEADQREPLAQEPARAERVSARRAGLPSCSAVNNSRRPSVGRLTSDPHPRIERRVGHIGEEPGDEHEHGRRTA